MSINKLTAKARIRIRKPPSEVFNAFADAKSMSQFWFTRRDDGLKQGETVSWFLGSGEEVTPFDVRVKELKRPNKIVIEWENGDDYTQVTWSFEKAEDGNSILTIEESGFTGDQDAIVKRAIDSTRGFNQVIVAAKAFIEYGVGLNVVADHA